MTKEMGSVIENVNPIYPVDAGGRLVPPIKIELGKTPEKSIEESIIEASIPIARYGVGSPPGEITGEIMTVQMIPEYLGKIPVINADINKDLKEVNLKKNEGILLAAEVTVAKAIAAKEYNPHAQTKLDKFIDNTLDNVTKILGGKATKAAIGGFLSIATVSCGLNPVSPTITPDATATNPTQTEVSPVPGASETPSATSSITPEASQTAEASQTPETTKNFSPAELESQKMETMPNNFMFANKLFTKTTDAEGNIKWITEGGPVEGVFYQPYQDKPIDFYFLAKSGKLSFYISPSSSVWLDLTGVKEEDANSFVRWFASNDVQYSKARQRLLNGDQLEIVIGDTAHFPLMGGAYVYTHLGEGDVIQTADNFPVPGFSLDFTGRVFGVTPYLPKGEERIVCGIYLGSNFLTDYYPVGDQHKVDDVLKMVLGMCGSNVKDFMAGKPIPVLVVDNQITNRLAKIGVKYENNK